MPFASMSVFIPAGMDPWSRHHVFRMSMDPDYKLVIGNLSAVSREAKNIGMLDDPKLSDHLSSVKMQIQYYLQSTFEGDEESAKQNIKVARQEINNANKVMRDLKIKKKEEEEEEERKSKEEKEAWMTKGTCEEFHGREWANCAWGWLDKIRKDLKGYSDAQVERYLNDAQKIIYEYIDLQKRVQTAGTKWAVASIENQQKFKKRQFVRIANAVYSHLRTVARVREVPAEQPRGRWKWIGGRRVYVPRGGVVMTGPWTGRPVGTGLWAAKPTRRQEQEIERETRTRVMRLRSAGRQPTVRDIERIRERVRREVVAPRREPMRPGPFPTMMPPMPPTGMPMMMPSAPPMGMPMPHQMPMRLPGMFQAPRMPTFPPVPAFRQEFLPPPPPPPPAPPQPQYIRIEQAVPQIGPPSMYAPPRQFAWWGRPPSRGLMPSFGEPRMVPIGARF